MSEDIKELVKRLREPHVRRASETNLQAAVGRQDERDEAALALEALAGEVERLTTNGIHTCHDQCQRLPCVQGREIRALTAERDRLKAALEEIVRHEVSREQFIMQGPAFAARMVSRVIEIARKALGDAS